MTEDGRWLTVEVIRLVRDICPAHSRVAQLVEQPAVNRRVAGSSPASGASQPSAPQSLSDAQFSPSGVSALGDDQHSVQPAFLPAVPPPHEFLSTAQHDALDKGRSSDIRIKTVA